MTMSSNAHTSVSKSEKVKCRVESCQEEVKLQNYGRHLERFHPNEDRKDRRPYGQGKFSFGVTRPPLKLDDGAITAEKTDDNENY